MSSWKLRGGLSAYVTDVTDVTDVTYVERGVMLTRHGELGSCVRYWDGEY